MLVELSAVVRAPKLQVTYEATKDYQAGNEP